MEMKLKRINILQQTFLQTRQAMDIQRNITAHTQNNHCCVKSISIKYYKCVSLFISLLCSMQTASFLCHILLSSVTSLAQPYFSTLSHEQNNFQKRFIEQEKFVLIFTATFCLKHFSF